MLMCYVDESGDTGALVPSERNTQPVFLISAVIVKQSSLKHLTRSIIDLKKRFFYWRKGWARSVAASAFFAVITTVAMAGVWEIVEWLYAVIDGGEAGAAFLGSQGDEWDAQKDILCDTLGALCSALLFLLLNRNSRSAT